MSNYLAVATVTATLQHVLLGPIQQVVPGAQVRTLTPGTVAGDRSARGINIYLYQVSPNPAWRNADLPARRADGTLVQRPQVALDLFYLISFHGAEEFLEPQRLLGATVAAMHAQPILRPDDMTQSIAALPNDHLAGSNLATQIESVKFTLLVQTTDEISKLWSIFFQTPYHLSVAYQGSVVLIEADRLPAAALPARTAQVWGGPRRSPWIERVDPASLPYSPGAPIHLRGRGLGGPAESATIGDIVAPAQMVSDADVLVSLPAGLRAGVNPVQVVYRADSSQARPRPTIAESNLAALVVQPIVGGAQFLAGTDPRNGESLPIVSLTLAPEAGPHQAVALVLNEVVPSTETRPPRSYSMPTLLRVGLPSQYAADLDQGTLSTALRQELRGNGIGLAPRVEVLTVAPGQTWQIVDSASGQTCAARLNDDEISVYFGLADPNLAGAVAFGVRGVAPGTYLLRVQVDRVASILTVDPNSDEYAGPLVTIE